MKLDIGGRYTRDHVVRRDTQAGTFEEINSPMVSSTERNTQSALLRRPQGRVNFVPRWLAVNGAVIAVMIAMLFVGGTQ